MQLSIEAWRERGHFSERIGGLGPEDFELEVDGEAVAIEYFTEVSERSLAGSPDGYQSAYATNAALASAFLLDYVATDEVMLALYEADPRIEDEDRPDDDGIRRLTDRHHDPRSDDQHDDLDTGFFSHLPKLVHPVGIPLVLFQVASMFRG